MASVTSGPGPQKGQTWRSSDDFGTTAAPSNTQSLRWEIDPTSNPNYDNIQFDVAEDISGSDKTVITGVMSGNRTAFVRYDKLYIGDVRGAGGKNFLVLVKTVTPD
ncbi:Hypothetical protein CAP_1413 [Chondromyces apiculatus DSM 436]|uniref:Uncharacterized protein n=2 Tax=Chondromyces apiculatus TaxID=51 RepID=A0A017STJ3_9BACT|nr:Hypothetical protein CAP_1413 [Chondromyces apiculatus DSM 436]